MDDEDRSQRSDHVSDQISNTEINQMVPSSERYDGKQKTMDEPNVVVMDLSVSLMPQSVESLETDYDLSNISFRETVIHLVSLSVCSLLLSIPFSANGIFDDTVGFVVTLTSLFLYLYSMNTFLWSKYKLCQSEGLPSLSYPSFVHFVLKDGPLNLRSFTGFGAHLTVTVFVLFLVCGCCYNFLLASENIRIVYNNLWPAESIDLELVMIGIIVPLLSLCWLVEREHLVLVSVLAHVLSMLCIAAVLYDNIYGSGSKFASSLGILTQMPFYLFSFFFMLHALGSSSGFSRIPVVSMLVDSSSSEEEECRKLNRLFAGIPVLLVYAVFGFRCSLKYGTDRAEMEETWQNVPNSNHSMAHQYALLTNAFALLFQYPLLVYLMFDIVQNSLARKVDEERSKSCLFARDHLSKVALTLIVFLSIYHLPYVDAFLILGNAFGMLIDSLLFPAFVVTLVSWRMGENEKLEGRFDRNMIIGFLALTLIVLGTLSWTLDLLRYREYDTVELFGSISMSYF